MNHSHRFVLAALLVAATTVRADSALDELVAVALANAPEAAAARATAEAARRRVGPAATLPDPFLSLTWQREEPFDVMVSQPIPWPGKLALARSAAASEAREVESGVIARANLTIEARVRNAWYDLVLARAIDRILEDRRESATQIEASVRERYAAGLAVQQDVLRAQVELARIDELTAAQAATIVSRRAELNRLAGRAQDTAIDTPNELPGDDAVPAADVVIASMAGRSPELAASRQAIETGRIRVELAKKNFLPDFVVSGSSMRQVGAGISLPIFVRQRQQNQLAEAQAQMRARTADADVVSRELELRTRERLAQLEAALRIGRLYRDRILPLDELSLESALASYQAGKVPFITVLDALNTLFNDRVLHAGRLAESAKWRVAINEASLGGMR